MDSFLIVRPRLHSMQRGKKGSWNTLCWLAEDRDMDVRGRYSLAGWNDQLWWEFVEKMRRRQVPGLWHDTMIDWLIDFTYLLLPIISQSLKRAVCKSKLQVNKKIKTKWTPKLNWNVKLEQHWSCDAGFDERAALWRRVTSCIFKTSDSSAVLSAAETEYY